MTRYANPNHRGTRCWSSCRARMMRGRRWGNGIGKIWNGMVGTMLRFLADKEIWRELRTLSRQRKYALYIAVPFLGNGGGRLLSLKRGDVLVVALTEANSRNGSVCPAEIGRLRRKGVKVFLSPNLHAKVVLCGRKAIVGSANLSQTSFAHLDEAAILTTDAIAIKHIGAWFRIRMLEPVSPEWLRICGEVYRPQGAESDARNQREADGLRDEEFGFSQYL